MDQNPWAVVSVKPIQNRTENNPSDPWAVVSVKPIASFRPVPAPPNVILEQNPGKKVPFKSPEIVHKAIGFIPDVAGQTGGLLGGLALGIGGTPEAPGIGTGAGIIAGRVAGAAIGGALGKELMEHAKHKIFNEDISDSKDVGWEAGKQAIYETFGNLAGPVVRAGASKLREFETLANAPLLGTVLEKMAGHPAPVEKESIEIAGTKIPLTRSQMDKAGPLSHQATHYLGGSWLGTKITAVKRAQEQASRYILGKLSGYENFNPDVLSANWKEASIATQKMATGMYNELGQIVAPEASKEAQQLLGDPGIATILEHHTAAKTALEELAVRGMKQVEAAPQDIVKPASMLQADWDSIGKNLGFKNAKEAINNNRKVFEDIVSKFSNAEIKTVSEDPTIRHAIEARSKLTLAAKSTFNREEKKALYTARNRLDRAIDKGLTPVEAAIKHRADVLWRRKYVMDEFSNELYKSIDRKTASGEPSKIIPDAFQGIVNDMAREKPFTNEFNERVLPPTDLETLFDTPEDQKAMKSLANFLTKRYSKLGGQSGVGERIAALGLMITAAHTAYALPSDIAEGKYAEAGRNAGYLAGAYILASALADPGIGARVIKEYLSTPTGSREASALGARLLGGIAGYKLNPPNEVTPEELKKQVEDIEKEFGPISSVIYPHTAINDAGHRIGSHDGKNWFDHETGVPF